jgi:hypothetical protein
MKKVTILVILSAVFLFSCRGTPSADTVAFRLLELYDVPPSTQYVKDGTKGEYGYISREDFTFLYTGNRKPLPEWELIEDFRIVLSDSPEPFELHVIRVRSSSDTEEIAKLLRKRADMIRYHNKTEDSYLVYEPTVFVRSRYVILAVTPDNNAVKLMLKRLI